MSGGSTWMKNMHTLRLSVKIAASQCNAQTSNETSCVVCHHMELKFRYMSKKYSDIYENAFKSEEAGMHDPSCFTDAVEPQVCETPLFPDVFKNKCFFRRTTVHFQGLIGHLPKAEMILTLYERGCKAQWITKPNGCRDFSELTQDEQGELIRKFHPIQKRWKVATFFATVCVI
ncbi:uncharacterized protein LOC132715216 [Ruditapes philippinarum]|uniref:uncharacterized protein LOC132715216 n=1 Tax=Ruditapes philippinarum TaxID=129788 RepID=UPI00295ABF79|nr:uncharacterized protein LOC132715216 [Ruditapes philippinarum]